MKTISTLALVSLLTACAHTESNVKPATAALPPSTVVKTVVIKVLPPDAEVVTPQPALPANAPQYPHLTHGDVGDKVTALQHLLVLKGYLKTSTYGYYGDLTRAAVMKFNDTNNIAGTRASKETWLKLLEGVE